MNGNKFAPSIDPDDVQENWLLEVLLNSTSDCVYFKDRQSRFLRISQKQMALFKQKNPIKVLSDDPEQAKGKTDFDFFSEVHAQKAYKDEQEIMRSGQPKFMEEKETWPDGTITYALTNKYCLKDEQQNVIGTFGISRDITAQKTSAQILEETQKRLLEVNNKLEEANRRLDIRLERAENVSLLGFWTCDIYASGPEQVKATDGVYRIFDLSPQKKATFTQLRELIHPEDREIWDENFRIATMGKEFNEYAVRLKFPNGKIKYLNVKLMVEKHDEFGLPAIMGGYVQDVTGIIRHVERNRGLELVLRGFQHMIPGQAIEAISALEELNQNDGIKKALVFTFMVRHKSDEVKSLCEEKSHFDHYSLGEILDNAWPAALDLARLNLDDLIVHYGAGIDRNSSINGAFYTAAVNILSNARLHGGAPFIVWIFLEEGKLAALFADGGKDKSDPSENNSTRRNDGVGLTLVAKVLSLVQGKIEELNSVQVQQRYDNPPADLQNQKTFYYVTLDHESPYTV